MNTIFAELLTLKPLFQGAEVKATPNPFQLDQLDKVFKVPELHQRTLLPYQAIPHWKSGLPLQIFPIGSKTYSIYKGTNSFVWNSSVWQQPGAHVSSRRVPRPMNVVGVQRIPPQAMQAYNLTSQAGMGGGMNPGGIAM